MYNLGFNTIFHHTYLVSITKSWFREGLKKKNYWKIPIRGGGRYIMQRPFRPKSPRGEPRDSHGQTLFMCEIKGFYCILVMHIVTF